MTIIAVLFSAHFSAQIFHNPVSNNLRFAGALNADVLALLSTKEKELINSCIVECGVNPDSVVWISPEVYDKLEDPDYYHTKVAYKAFSNLVGGINLYEGKYTLTKPEFMIFLDRYNGDFEVIVQMYH